MDFDFKLPSTVPQDLLLIQDLIGTLPPLNVSKKPVPDSPDSSNDSITSTDGEAESEDEVEAGLAARDDDSGMSAATSDSASPSDSELDASSSDSEEGGEYAAPQRQRPPDDFEDEESDVTAAATYLQTKNEIVDANIMVPTISEVEPCDTLEKVGEIMSIVGNIVIVRGLPVDHVNSLSERALDAESLLVFDDRKVLGYVYETFGPTSQPFYQVKFNQHYPLDTDKVWLSREVFHVPQRSHFVFVGHLKKLRGSDASNIHDEEPADDEIEFSDDEKEAAFRAQRKKRRGRSVSSSRQPTPVASRIHIDDMAQDTYRGSNPYDAHGPYDDDYHVTAPSRPPPVPYDDPYADVPTSDVRVRPMEMNGEFGRGPNWEGGGDGPNASRGRISSWGTRGRGVRNHQLWSTSRRGYRLNPIASQRTFDSDAGQSLPVASRMVERATGYGQIGHTIAPHPLGPPASNAWLSPETNNIQGYGQSFIQPHINPRFASMFGLNFPSGSMIPWASQNAQDHTFPTQHWVDTWTMHGSAGSEGEGDTYRPM
ncbi:NAF1-domain-containing protein [Imleria badia]|nr:NAF1-domain-containing protein [Imleria badia]